MIRTPSYFSGPAAKHSTDFAERHLAATVLLYVIREASAIQHEPNGVFRSATEQAESRQTGQIQVVLFSSVTLGTCSTVTVVDICELVNNSHI